MPEPAAGHDWLRRALGAVRRRWGLVLVLAVALAGHAWVIARAPAPGFFEDEPHYNLFAHLDARAGNTSLLPGTLRFDQRPELISRLWSNFLTEADVEAAGSPDAAKRSTAVWRRARTFNLALFLVLLVLTHAQATTLGLGRAGATAATAVLATFPWFGFYVHTLWAEILHAFLAAVAFLCLFLHFRSRRLAPVAVAGLAVGWALLAKATLNPFVPVVLLFLAGVGFLGRRDAPPARRLARALVAPALFAACVFLVVGPQLIRNQRDGHGMRIAGNRWKNLEMGLRLEPREQQDVYQRTQRAALHELYMSSAEEYEVREALAKERVVNYVRKRPGWVLGTQLRKLRTLILDTPSFFDRALVERWGTPAPAWLLALQAPARWMWYGLLALGLVGLVLALRRGPGWLLLALFVGYFATALLVIPYKMRFVMPLVPVLCLFLGSTVDGAVELVRRRRQRRTPSGAGSDEEVDAPEEPEEPGEPGPQAA